MNSACGSSVVHQAKYSVEPSPLTKASCFSAARKSLVLHFTSLRARLLVQQHNVEEKLHGFESVFNCHCHWRHGGRHVGHVHDERATGRLARLWHLMHANPRPGTADLVLQDSTAIRVPREKSPEQWSLACRLQRHLPTLMSRLPGPRSRTLPTRPTGTLASRPGRSGRLSKGSHPVRGRLPRVRALDVHAHRVLGRRSQSAGRLPRLCRAQWRASPGRVPAIPD